MADKQIRLNRDGNCPNCGDGKFKSHGAPTTPGEGESVNYTSVIECLTCRHVRGKLG